MHLKNLSNQDLLHKTKEAVREEKSAMLLVLQHLREVERRMLYAVSHSSLFDYCISELGYDGRSAHNRIAAMRVIRDLPEVEAKMQEGRLNLTLLSQAQTFFRRENIKSNEKKLEILSVIEGKSTREAQKEFMDRAETPEAHMPEKVQVISKTHSQMTLLMDEECFLELKELQAIMAHAHPNAWFKRGNTSCSERSH